MNCQDFNNCLDEYLDKILGAADQAAAREHLRQCAACRRALHREETAARSIRRSLDRATAGLWLRPETRRAILKEAASRATLSSAWKRAWQWYIASPLRPAAAGAALLAVLLLLIGIPLLHRSRNDSRQTIAGSAGDNCVIDVPIQTHTRIFRLEKGTVQDAMDLGVAVGRARFPDNNERSSKAL
jgi:Putative zinc-finger